MFQDYVIAVSGDYRKKKESDVLFPSSLKTPTTAFVQRECEAVCMERYDKKDEGILRSFFGKQAGKEGYIEAIKGCKPDKFKALVNYMKGESATTNVKNLDLLAWLIDFKHRPYNDKFDYEVYERGDLMYELPGGKSEGKEGEAGDGKKTEEVTKIDESNVPVAEEVRTDLVVNLGAYQYVEQTGRRVFNLNLIKGAAVVVLLALAVAGFRLYGVRVNKFSTPSPTGPQGCMFWAGDHYQQVDCGKKVEGELVVALDTEKLEHFKLISTPDTITEAAIGKVWWGKYNGAVEFYTGDGFHPIDTRLRLHPITGYMIRKYCVVKQ